MAIPDWTPAGVNVQLSPNETTLLIKGLGELEKIKYLPKSTKKRIATLMKEFMEAYPHSEWAWNGILSMDATFDLEGE